MRFFYFIQICLWLVTGASNAEDSLPNKEAALLIQEAEGGNASAEFNLGYSYYYGKDVPQDIGLAIHWFLKSAEQNYAPAEFMLGLAYESGNGVEDGKIEAAKWYQKAANHGLKYAETRLSAIKAKENSSLISMSEIAGDVLGGNNSFIRNPAGMLGYFLAFSSGAETQSLSRLGEPENFISLKVFFGTDRALIDTSDPNRIFDGRRGEMTFGSCKVSIPRDHKMGELESPNWMKFEFRENPEKHVVLLDVNRQSKQDFFSDLRNYITNSKEKQAFIFIHGYNVSFSDAARRTAQMAYDLGFNGVPIFFSWPSQDKTEAYTVDEANEEWAASHLKTFLMDIARSSDAEKVFLIAHSMGSRALSTAVREIASEHSGRQLFKEVILAAPDIDAEVFIRDVLPKMRLLASRITLYASSKDKALQASKKLHGHFRAGSSDLNELVIVPGLDTIDASLVDTSFLGHSYYGDNRSVISDIYDLVRNGNAPNQRNLIEKKRNSEVFWSFRP